jgi:hypothetical protein
MIYAEWIKKNVPVTYGTCREATRDMQKEFPHLRRVRGHYCCPFWGRAATLVAGRRTGKCDRPYSKSVPLQRAGRVH